MAFVRRAAQTVYHPTSTCAIGSVVDPELRVYGIEGLRVADASVMPTITRGEHERRDDHDRREGRGPDQRTAAPRPPSRGERLMSTDRADRRGDLLSEQDWTGKIFSDGWVDAPETIETVEPATGEVLGTAGVANAASVAAAAKSAARAQREWAAMPLAERVAVVRARRRAARAAPRRDRGLDGARVGLRSRRRPTWRSARRSASSTRPRRSSRIRSGTCCRRSTPGSDVDRAPRADRRRRRDHAVELPDRPRDALGRPGARARQRGRAQERPEHAGQRRRDHRARLRGGRAARRASCTCSAAAPRSARRSSRTRTSG